MRGADSYNESLFTTVKLEDFVPANHPLRPIRTWVNEAPARMDAKFSAMYEADVKGGRPSIAPEKPWCNCARNAPNEWQEGRNGPSKRSNDHEMGRFRPILRNLRAV